MLSKLSPLAQLLRLDLLGYGAKPAGVPPDAPDGKGGVRRKTNGANGNGIHHEPAEATAHANATAATMGEEDELPLSVILDENGGGASSILAGRELTGASRAVTLNKNVLRRHAAVLGGSGSGKTTLALCLIEQLLLRGIPAVLIDRKGDLCSYANPDVWRENAEEFSERRGEREKLADAIDVAVFTPGRASGRPISITLLPNGINELPEHEQQLLANLSAAALGEMLHLKNSATHQKQSGTLSVALRILGARHSREVTLSDLIGLLEDEDPELSDLTQRMDPSGKLRRDLVAQLDSLRHRNSALFEAGGESLRMESLLGLGRYAREGRTRLSIIYTGFLGDNENILFWVSQFLSEALRFCQRNPNDELQAVVMFDEADLYIPANAKPATAEPLQSLLKRARSAGLGMMLATQSPGDLDYKSRDQITSWFIGRVREDTALRKLKAAFQSESGLEPAAVLPGQTVGEFHLVQEGLVRPMKAQRSLITAEQVPFDRIEQLARETKGQDERQLRLFDLPSTRK
jgi:DNA helicase HerA-like ATPase